MANAHSRDLASLLASPSVTAAGLGRLVSAGAATRLGHHFLHAPPRAVDVGAPPLHFPSPLFRTCLQLRLGLPLTVLRGVLLCPCGRRSDPHGRHVLSCVTGGLTFHRHEAAVGALASLARAAGYAATTTNLQHVYPARPPGPGVSVHYRPDLRIDEYPSPGDSTLVDVTVVHPVSAERVAHPRAGRRRELAAAEAAIARKEQRLAAHLRATAAASGAAAPPGSRFVVAAWETFGAAAQPTAVLVADLLRAACDRVGLDGSAAASLRRSWRYHLSSVVAMAVARQVHTLASRGAVVG